MRRVSATPLHLVKLTLLGSVAMMLIFAETFLTFPRPLRHHGLLAMLWSERLELVCVVLPLLTGMAMIFWNNHRLSSGINHLRFSDDELEEARRFVSAPTLTYVQVTVFAAAAIVALVQLHSRRANGDTMIFILLAVNPLSYLRATLRRTAVQSAPIDWNLAQPIHSDQWGKTT